MRRSMLTFSTLSLAALLCYAFHKYFGIDQIMERVAAYPMTIWLITFGLHIGDSVRSKTSLQSQHDLQTPGWQ